MKYVTSIEVREEENEMATAIVHLSERMEVLSNAPLNGGRCLTDTLFIMQVTHDYENADYMSDLKAKRAEYGLPYDTVGFMTAAEVKYVISSREEPCCGDSVFVAATAGVTNCVRAGEPLDDWEVRKEHSKEIYDNLMAGASVPVGTINVISVSPVPLTNGAKVNLMIPIVEAKTLSMRDMGYSETGTTSDAMAVVSPVSDERVPFAGTGSELGMATARAVRATVAECISNRGEAPIPKSAVDMIAETGATPDMFWHCAKVLGLGEDVMEEFGDTLEEMAGDPDVCTLIYSILSAGDLSDKRCIMNQEDDAPEILVDGTLSLLIASRISEERGNDSAIDLVGLDPLTDESVPEYVKQAVYGLTAGVVAYMTGYSDD